MKQPLFKFGLWPIEDARPWGTESNPEMPWMALSDGWHTLICGDVELMRCSDAYLATLDETPPTTQYVDYGVFRLSDDLLSIAANVLYPIPKPLLSLVNSPEREREFLARADAWMKPNWSAPEFSTHHYHLVEWWAPGRSLMTGYARGVPEVRMWSDGEFTHIRWTASSDVEPQSGARISAIKDGEFSLPTVEFVAELRRFHADFTSQMRTRMARAPSVFPALFDEAKRKSLVDHQRLRESGLERALEWDPHKGRDWSRTIALVNDLLA